MPTVRAKALAWTSIVLMIVSCGVYIFLIPTRGWYREDPVDASASNWTVAWYGLTQLCIMGEYQGQIDKCYSYGNDLFGSDSAQLVASGVCTILFFTASLILMFFACTYNVTVLTRNSYKIKKWLEIIPPFIYALTAFLMVLIGLSMNLAMFYTLDVWNDHPKTYHASYALAVTLASDFVFTLPAGIAMLFNRKGDTDQYAGVAMDSVVD
ncbi:hypothetical protein Pelo_11569 [Pelomyxa schiedti]|nr:hypothetical protein Pelo_11569 [Pelomyxa schiedti]